MTISFVLTLQKLAVMSFYAFWFLYSFKSSIFMSWIVKGATKILWYYQEMNTNNGWIKSIQKSLYLPNLCNRIYIATKDLTLLCQYQRPFKYYLIKILTCFDLTHPPCKTSKFLIIWPTPPTPLDYLIFEWFFIISCLISKV